MSPPIQEIPTIASRASATQKRPVRYDKGFKRDAIRRWKSSRRSAREIARELGISAAAIYAWGRELRSGLDGIDAGQYLRRLERELAHLTEENARLKQQCEILKKTLGILVEPTAGVSVNT